MNTQIPEKARLTDGHVLEIQSIFATLQGEGLFSGAPAVFIRLAGCNLQCPGCDTDYVSKRNFRTVSQIVDKVREVAVAANLKQGFVVITGGEPFRQELALLVEELRLLNYVVQIETNGTLPPSDKFLEVATEYSEVWIMCSPKTGKLNRKLEKLIDGYKYVISHDSIDQSDGLPIQALGHPVAERVARPKKDLQVPIYVQPFDSQDPATNILNMEACARAAMTHGYLMQLQIHKIIGLE